MQVHACLLALHTGRPVKMVYDREESFFGHVHRHPARMRYEHGATATAGSSTSRPPSCSTAARTRRPRPRSSATPPRSALGPYDVPNVHIDGYGVRTNNPPCGAMRGFGAVQACFAYEAQMDKLAAALGMDPVEIRLRNALETRRQPCPPARSSTGPRRVAELLRRGGGGAPRRRPSVDGAACGAPRRASATPPHGEGVRRGVGYAVGFKNVGFSEGFDDYSTARVRLEVVAVSRW